MDKRDELYFDKKFGEVKDGVQSNPLGCLLAGAVGLAGLVGSLAFGPVDFTRMMVSRAIGDTPALKASLLEYSRRDVLRKHPTYTPEQIDIVLADELNYHKIEGRVRINPQEIGFGRLWDAAEDHAESQYQRWFWTGSSR